MNRLPEKLTTLRKHFGYAQGDIAQKLGVAVTEYMNWENGNKICTIQQLIALAEIFEVTPDMLVDNTKELVLPPAPATVVLPLFPDVEEASGADVSSDATMQLNAVEDTRAYNTIEFEPTRVNEIVDTTAISSSDAEKEAEAEREARKARIAARRKKQEEEKKKKQRNILIAGISAAAVVLVILLILLLKGCSSSKELNEVGSVNRLALGDTYSLYVNKNGSLTEHGQFSPKESFDGVVQVSAYDDHALGLKADGTVVSSDADPEVDEWEDITMIAAGAYHSAGLKADGTVVCTGDENACEVESWEDIVSIYAGNAVTVGVKADGSIVSSGSIDSAAANQTDVESVAFAKSAVIIVKKDGSVLTYGTDIDTTSWTNVESAAAGNKIAVGLKSDHTLAVSCSDEEMAKKISGWSNIRYIAVNGNTVIAINGNEKMYGIGDNDYGQYEVTAQSEDEEKEQLEKPKNIQVTETTVNIVIKWDAVENADYYEVKMDSDPETKAEVDNNQTSVAVSALEDGKTYKIEVIAHSEDEDKYEESEAAEYSYTYKSVSEQLGPVKNITDEVGNGDTWILHWDAVENADYYIVVLDGGAEQETIQNTITLATAGTNVTAGSTHNITVQACSDSSAYTPSDVSKTQLTYRVAEKEYTFTIVFMEDAREVGRVYKENVKEGVYDVTSDIPSGYSLTDPSASKYTVPNDINTRFDEISFYVFDMNANAQAHAGENQEDSSNSGN